MVRLTNKQMQEILRFAASLTGTREQIEGRLRELYLKIDDNAQGSDFKRELASRLDMQQLDSVAPDLTPEDWAAAAKAIGDSRVIHFIAKSFSPLKRKEHFPHLVGKFEDKVDEAGTPAAPVGTTTANTAPYPVPMGQTAAGARKKKKKKR